MNFQLLTKYCHYWHLEMNVLSGDVLSHVKCSCTLLERTDGMVCDVRCGLSPDS